MDLPRVGIPAAGRAGHAGIVNTDQTISVRIACHRLGDTSRRRYLDFMSQRSQAGDASRVIALLDKQLVRRPLMMETWRGQSFGR